MVKRTDFRPNNNSSSNISAKNRILIREGQASSGVYLVAVKTKRMKKPKVFAFKNKSEATSFVKECKKDKSLDYAISSKSRKKGKFV